MKDKQSKDLYERISFYEMSMMKNDSDEIKRTSNKIKEYSNRIKDFPIGNELIQHLTPYNTDDIDGLTYGFTPQKIKETLQWLISEGYLNGSKIEITSAQIIFYCDDQSPITEKGMEYYKKLSKNYGQEYLTELAKKYFDKKNKNNSEK